jgi:transcriptional regulator with XRE-family HTH domain
MQFREWIDKSEKSGKSQAELARELGCSQADISRYCSGDVIPRPDRMQKIVEYTGGEVTANDFYNNERENNGKQN